MCLREEMASWDGNLATYDCIVPYLPRLLPPSGGKNRPVAVVKPWDKNGKPVKKWRNRTEMTLETNEHTHQPTWRPWDNNGNQFRGPETNRYSRETSANSTSVIIPSPIRVPTPGRTVWNQSRGSRSNNYNNNN